MQRYFDSQIAVDLNSADPTNAINAFFHNMNKVRSLGMTPRTEWSLAEELLRGQVKVMLYTSRGCAITLTDDEDALDQEETWELMLFAIDKIKARRERKPDEEAVRSLPIMPRQKGGLVRAAQKAKSDGVIGIDA